jgi:hypothetical protein
MPNIDQKIMQNNFPSHNQTKLAKPNITRHNPFYDWLKGDPFNVAF